MAAAADAAAEHNQMARAADAKAEQFRNECAKLRKELGELTGGAPVVLDGVLYTCGDFFSSGNGEKVVLLD